MSKKLFALLLLMVACTYSYAQNDSMVINRNIKALEKYAINNPIEKVHLHLDRQFYFPGDTIWFKAYVVLGAYHKLSALSNILYAELIGPKDSVMRRLTIGLNAGTSPGFFDLPYKIAAGTYHIRAYTNWMRNDGPDYFFDQQVTVLAFSTKTDAALSKSVAGPNKTTQQSPDKIDLQFFPEGGDLINGLRSKVAFKAINQNGVSEQVQGSIQDNSGNEVATFNTQHLGMGVFPLGPQKGVQYIAKVKAADGSAFTVPLPLAKDAGFTLSINNNLADSLYIKVAAKNVTDTAFYIVAQSGGKYCFAAGHKLADKVFTATIPKDRFPIGIVQFTLFSQSGEPLNERIIFIQNDNQLNLALKTENQAYLPGEKVKFDLEAKNSRGEAATGTFSVSVVDETRVPLNDTAENTIFTDLLLQSELAGNIEEPNYYFTNPNDQTMADLDLLMLTQGYHRFEWKKILSNTNPSLKYLPEKGFSLSGSVTTPGGKPVPNGKVLLTYTKTLTVLDTLTDAAGKFAFRDLIFPDTARLIVNAKKANGGSNVVLSIDKPYFPEVNKSGAGNTYIANHFAVTAEQIKQAYAAWRKDSLSQVIQLKEVTIKDHKTPPIHPDYAVLLKHSENLNGPGMADQVILGDQLVGCVNIADCLLYLAHGGIRSVASGSTTVFYTTHRPIGFSGGTKPMAVLLDGVILDQSALLTLSPSDVQSIEMLESPMYSSIYGSAATGGLIVITTKYGDEPMQQVSAQSGLTVFSFKGFFKSRQFYSPKYTAEKKVTLADNRKTIYWDPGITTDAAGKAAFEYFNGGSKGNYSVVIEGIDGEGKLGRQVLNYTVQ